MGKCPAAHGALQQRAAFIFGWRRPKRRTARPEGARKEERMNQQGLGPIARAAAAERMRETDAAARVRAEYEESPEYRIGCELLDGLTQELGISAEQAAALLASGARPESMDVLSRKAAAMLIELEREGKLQRSAGEYLQDSAFQKLLLELPAAAAVRVYDAEHGAAAAAGQPADPDARQRYSKSYARAARSPRRCAAPRPQAHRRTSPT